MHQTLSPRAGDAIHLVLWVELRVWLVRLYLRGPDKGSSTVWVFTTGEN